MFRFNVRQRLAMLLSRSRFVFLPPATNRPAHVADVMLSRHRVRTIRFNPGKHPAKEANSNLFDRVITRKSLARTASHREAASVIFTLETSFRVVMHSLPDV